ncbi:DUF2064 domain-containing protein [Kitasatospora sp. NPDC101801]|uniref:DUF2064 domain-containing protein n=1 Tax=Kitasatospora sp. NPDC101801 TaxID=3364103 RepID=UPI0037FA3834
MAGGLDRRLAAAFGHAPAGSPALLVGMDTPQLGAAVLADPLAAGTRAGVDAWYGPATDGGFWALGLARPTERLARDLLLGVPMSTDRTGAVLLERLDRTGLRVHRLPRLTDVDTAVTAAEVARAAPDGRFAACLDRIAAAARAPR